MAGILHAAPFADGVSALVTLFWFSKAIRDLK
jgi:hypothetical protein